ncbi:hypothetical protein I4U30_21560 [Enterobacter asburiae]|uniref:hypothetical protein n=1 Tax=Enterobacter asburiae TaxID=61645 RepID=UPI00192B8D80|nr:hypothetical protein [Enterobacter asburiae]MBL5840876.1 hypothetical protein [Enterobacter asburiae]
MKHCPRCKQDKPFEMFYKNKSKKDGYQGFCKECKKKIDNDQYANNPKRKMAINERSERIRTFHRLLMRRYKRMKGCLLCNEKEPVALDLHHLDPEQKDMSPAEMVSFNSERFKAEIRKCVVLCANCHRKVHAGILRI